MKKECLVKRIYLLVFTVLFILSQQRVAFANPLENEKVVTGSLNLLDDVMLVLQILAPILAGVLIAWHFIKMKLAEDDGEIKPIKKHIKIIIYCCIGVFVISSIVKVVISYYK